MGLKPTACRLQKRKQIRYCYL